MPINYPTSFDTLTNPTSTDALTSPSHADQHANANDILEALESRAGLKGTSFPGSPTSGDRFLRTDRNIEYFYDGTRWLSATLYKMDFNIQREFNPTGTSGVSFDAPFPHPTYDVYAETFYGYFYVTTTNDGSNYWTIVWSGQTLSTASNSPNAWVLESTTVNGVVTNAGASMAAVATKVSAPGTIYVVAALLYRLIG